MTLRARLLIALVLVGIAVLGTFAAVVGTQHTFLLQQVDRQLVAGIPPAQGFGRPGGFGNGPAPADQTPANDIPAGLFELYVGRVDAAGVQTDVITGPTSQGVPDVAARAPALAAKGGTATVPAKAGHHDYRVLVFRPQSSTTYVVLGLPLTRVDDAMGRLELVLGAAGVAVVAVLALLGWWVSRLGLRPIRAMTDAADAIAQGDLSRRVAPAAEGTEAGSLGRAFNVMLDARQASEERLRRFVSDASHELRSPLTSIRGYVDLYRRGALADQATLDDAMRRVGQEAHRMGGLVDDLLLLARLDEGRPMNVERVDITSVLHDAADDAGAVQPDRPITVDVATGLTVEADEARLRQVVAALVTNALVHTPPTSALHIRGRHDGADVVIEVADDGPGMTPDVAAHAFERFYRGDPSRSRHRGGSGLGLAIVQSVVEALHGSVSLTSSVERGTSIRLGLAAAPGSVSTVVLADWPALPDNFQVATRTEGGEGRTIGSSPQGTQAERDTQGATVPTILALDRPGTEIPVTGPVVDVTVPVFNEEHVLRGSIERLHTYLSERFPFTWRITIVDNASTDGTFAVASALAGELTQVRALHLDRKGRGLALRTAWTGNDAQIVTYMDVDLSTGLDALLPLVAPLVSGHSDMAIGSRLARGADVARGPKREFISRCYNMILRTVFAVRFSDAQCGFKAIRSDVAARLIPQVEDDAWFFDTELLLLAERAGLRVHEVPVDWIDDPDSRVNVAKTAIEDLRGVARMTRRFAQGRTDLGVSRPRIEDDMGRQLVSFGVVGLTSTIVSLVLYLLLRGPLSPVGAVLVAVPLTFVANTWANRRFTAGRRMPRRGWTTAAALFASSLALSAFALAAVVAAGGGLFAELATLILTGVPTTVVRFALVRSWAQGGRPAAPVNPALAQATPIAGLVPDPAAEARR